MHSERWRQEVIELYHHYIATLSMGELMFDSLTDDELARLDERSLINLVRGLRNIVNSFHH